MLKASNVKARPTARVAQKADAGVMACCREPYTWTGYLVEVGRHVVVGAVAPASPKGCLND
jgi:hypothetical protein